ncbi:hypothetical protein Pint_14268 [Pistacia integerrima]|uniref:Uncharacterized protein n=1 Tax=Pistacia integerrima TaxID=434235 RepID=A0ACC0YA89_9ROSI|nr:hypothetical protein Pint_14268 [Pistacia integerrima]
MIAAAGYAIWNNKAACNKSYRVKCIGATNKGVPQPCTGASVVVKIVDLCPQGCRATFDLSQEAFAKIAKRERSRSSTLRMSKCPLLFTCRLLHFFEKLLVR